MYERSQCGKGGGQSYDPQVGAAAAANTALAEKTQAWTEDFYTKHIAPLMEQTTAATKANTAQQADMYAINKDNLDTATSRYKTLGIPAEDRYYKMVDEFSAPEEQERQAQGALGDLRTASANRDASLMRKFGGLGIDPTSPAGMSAMSDFAVQDAAAEAAAQTRARGAAKTLGMSLTADAANFGRGGQSVISSAGGAASGNSSNAAQVAGASVGAASAGSAPVINAAGVAQRAYGSNLDAYTSLQKQQNESAAAGAGGLGSLVGTLGSAFIARSDRRVKKNIRKLVRLSTGLNLYAFNYVYEADDTPPHSGVMADEVEKVFPEAVSVGADGYKMVDYSRIAL